MSVSTLQQEVHALADQLSENATWRDVAYQAAIRAQGEEGLAEIRSGRVVEGHEVLEWIDSWGTDHESKSPQLRR